MEIPYEIQNLLNIDNNGIAIIESSIIKYINNSEEYFLSEILNSLGQSSNIERHLYKPITTSETFYNSENIKKIILKIDKNIIIGFILYGYRPIFLRNEYNLKYFSKILLTVNDFYVYRPYQRMNYGKELFDKLIQIENVKPVSMAFEFPNRAIINFLYKHYGINNPINQINNIITYFNFSDKSFNKYLDDYHRVIDVNKMENDIESYRKWSPLNKDYYKIYNSDYTYKNIFPLQYKNNKININTNRYNNIANNIQKNYFNNNKIYDNIERNRSKNELKEIKPKMRYSYDFKNTTKNDTVSKNLLELKQYNNNSLEKDGKNLTNNYSYNNINNFDEMNNNEKDRIARNIKQYHLLDDKNIYGKKNNNNKNSISLNNKNPVNLKRDEYYFKFNDYYLNENINSYSSKDFDRDIYNKKNSVKDNYYNHINDENRHLKKIIDRQKEKSDKLSVNISNLNDRITENIYKTPQKNNYNRDFYYHKNRSFATLFDSIQNKLQEEKDYNDYKKYKISQEYSNY